MDMSIDGFGDTTSEEVPDDNASIIAADSQQRTAFVECTRHSNAGTVQLAVRILFGIIMVWEKIKSGMM